MSVHLYTRSSFSLLQSTIRIPSLVKKAKEMGYEAVTLTDHNVMYGAASFIAECKKQNIKGIIGLEVDCFYHEEVVPFLLLCRDNQGYKDLMVLSSILSDSQHTCSLEDLQKASAHCFLIVYGEGGWFDGALVKDDANEIREKLSIMKEELGTFDVALSYNEASLWKIRNEELKRIAQSLQIKTVALNKIYYLEASDASSLKVLRGISKNLTVHDASLTEIKGRYFLSKEEMVKLYEKDDLDRSDEIASMCKADYNIEKTELVHYPLKEGVEAKEYLKQLCFVGLNKRLNGRRDKRYEDRLSYELSIITKMHFENYFLIVFDFIAYARKKGIYIGPGRGSAAGSLVAYSLGITMIDPMKYDLLFERFLNPERISMPDIDVDIPDKNRSEVIEYVYQKYGEDHVANIVTFGTFGARQVIRDVAKVMNFFESDLENVLRLIPSNTRLTLSQIYDSSPRLKQLINSEDKYTKLFEMAKRIEGLPRHTSVHAGGIIMSYKPLNEVVPTIHNEDSLQTSQYTMEYLEERGLIKMDFLGLRNLSIIDEIVQNIKEREPSFNIMNIPLNDSKTYQVFANANTLGVFQFESEGMKKLLRRMKPKNINEVAMAMAIYRPGPMEHIDDFIEQIHHPEKIHYASNDLKRILQPTYGIMIYQEQIMQTAQSVAGFTLGRADILRRGISKKKSQEVENMKADFFNGAKKNGYDEKTIQELFATIERFAGYGFNKSHAIAYSYIAYQMAYLKANYPFDFYISLLNSVISDPIKTSQYIDECKRRKIPIYYPNVNESSYSYLRKGNGLLLPLSVIKGIHLRIAQSIALDVKENGQYEDLYDFVARSHILGVSRSQLESLIDGGALDCFNETRMTLKYALDGALNYADVVQIQNGSQISLDLSLVSKPEMIRRSENVEYREEYERKALGFSLAPSLISKIKEANHINTPSLSSLRERRGFVEGFAQIKSARSHRTKKGSMMAFLTIADESDELDMMVMPRQYTNYSTSLMKGVYILFHAKIQEDGSWICESIKFYKK